MANDIQSLDKITPEDIARTFESAYHVFQGDHEHMEDLFKNGAGLLQKSAQKFTSTQLVLGIAAIAGVAIFFINRADKN
ncbi:MULTISPECIES: hypothetical protein [Hymenobacter]|uniref:DUF883 domain-containing protein n=2 Tax=Hymenobacter TaxID=89966 RepID=A0ABS6X4I3_9BACT|nr:MULTISPECIES: hypothetical protein [Hymenobacter]MBO3271174.1 hypothetical protein [Hymenobacter defluvii]MBW3130609.1 hypothetical protein [Hymenobacter profundi]QNE41449.1 hypothetical protein F1C16_18725 [Hymenobacter sp. NBH84]